MNTELRAVLSTYFMSQYECHPFTGEVNPYDVSWVPDRQAFIEKDGIRVLENVTPEMVRELDNYFVWRHVKVRFYYRADIHRLIIIKDGTMQYCMTEVVFQAFGFTFNRKLDDRMALCCYGRADISFGSGSYINPSCQFRVNGRYGRNPNIVVEVNFTALPTIADLVQRGIDYFNFTDNVLSVLLLQIYEYSRAPAEYGMVLCEMRRTFPVPVVPGMVKYKFHQLVSFGNVALQEADERDWIQATQNLVLHPMDADAGPITVPAGIRGVGYSDPNTGLPYPACHTRNMSEYTYSIPGMYCLSLDANCTVFYQDMPLDQMPTLDIDLFQMVNALVRHCEEEVNRGSLSVEE